MMSFVSRTASRSAGGPHTKRGKILCVAASVDQPAHGRNDVRPDVEDG